MYAYITYLLHVSFKGLYFLESLFIHFFKWKVEIVRSRGYACTIHHVTTDDGYILELHRIGSNKKRPILLQHGLLGTSADWIINPTKDSLGNNKLYQSKKKSPPKYII